MCVTELPGSVLVVAKEVPSPKYQVTVDGLVVAGNAALSVTVSGAVPVEGWAVRAAMLMVVFAETREIG